MRTLTALSAIYLVSASAFGVAITLQRNPPLAKAIWHGASVANDTAVTSADKFAAWGGQFFDAINPPRIAGAAPPVHVARAPVPVMHKSATPPVAVARAELPPVEVPAVVAPALRPAIPEAAPEPEAKAAEAPKPDLAPDTQAPAQQMAAATPPARRPDLAMPGPGELTRVMLRLKDNLTSEMLGNFELFLYVSKAESGPWAQRMYVFRKKDGGNLDLLYDWPVSTGRELDEVAPNGQRAPSFTPQGYYELDPDRMYKHHMSGQWHQPMPHAMFFSWEKNGMQTGLAIHGASGDDIALLGRRASAGCVRLAPENAATLFNIIKTQYRGLAPRFAYDRRTATMSNDGLMMHDSDGKLQLAEGYKVLVFIENYGGDNVVAAIF